MHWKYNSGSGYRQKQTKEQINTKPKPPNDCKMTAGTYTTVSLASCLDTLEIADTASRYTYKFMEVSSPCGRCWSPSTATNTCTVLLNIALKILKYWHNKVSTHYSHICLGLHEAISHHSLPYISSLVQSKRNPNSKQIWKNHRPRCTSQNLEVVTTVLGDGATLWWTFVS